MTLRRGRAGGDRLSETSSLATAFRSGEQVTAADCRRLQVVADQWAAPMVCLPRHDELPADCTGQASKGKAVQGQGKLAAVDGEVLATGDGSGGQGCLRDRTDIQRRGCRDRGWDTRYAPPMVTALPVGGLRFLTH